MTSIDKLTELNRLAEQGGGEERVKKQHASGKLTARERIDILLDRDTFSEIDKFVTSAHSEIATEKFYGDGVITGSGRVNGRPVFIFVQDFTVYGGSLASAHAKKIVKVMDLAVSNGCPLIGLNDSGGARIQEGVESLAGYADIFLRNVLCSGVVPQLSLILGPCAGGAVYSPAITDLIFMVDQKSHMFITGPEVIKAVTKEDVTKEDLGGALAHNTLSGVSHFISENDKSAIELCRKILCFLPQNNLEKAPYRKTVDLKERREESLNSIIPASPNHPYDIRDIIRLIADEQLFTEVQSLHAQNIIIGFVHLNGYPTGIVANQPNCLAGCLDIDASVKAARFVRLCDAFNVPLLTLVDVPGFLPGVAQEHGGIIRHGAKLLYAFAEATVPKVTLITRKAYGGAYDVMSSKHLRGDFNFAYPGAEVAVMGPEGAVNIIYRKELEAAKRDGNLEVIRERLVADYREQFSNPWKAARLGYLDRIIEPAVTRQVVIDAFSLLQSKMQTNPRKKHGNIPL
jgi:propionyl-CoA carboxylase beta chain